MFDTDLTELVVRLLFFAAVIFGGLFLLYLVNLVVSGIGDALERAMIAHLHPQAARRQLDKRFAQGKITLEEYRRLRDDINKREQG